MLVIMNGWQKNERETEQVLFEELSSTSSHPKSIYEYNPQLTWCYLAQLMCKRDRTLRSHYIHCHIPSGVVSNDSSPTDIAESIAAD